MQLYEIVLPVEDNSGNSYEGSHIAFRSWLLDELGGYTQQPNSAGGWKDQSGKCYFDIVTPYRVACESKQWDNVIHKASELFNDQHAFMWSNIGTAAIWERSPIAA
jgi:hypothetical protein